MPSLQRLLERNQLGRRFQKRNKNKYFNLFSKITVPISVNLLIFSIGISTESKKIEKLSLKNNHKDIVIIIENWEMLSSEVQDFIIILLKNKEKFIKRYSKKQGVRNFKIIARTI